MASTVWRGHLAFGLVSFPVRLFRAARAEKVSFKRLYRPAAPAAPPAPATAERKPPLEPAAPPRRDQRSADEGQAKLPYQEKEAAVEAPVFRTHNAVTAETGDEPVGREQLVKGFEYEKGQYVVLEDTELKSITAETSKEMQIVEFVRMAEIDPIFLETSYYLAPEEAGERPYTLLQEALHQTGYVGLAQLAMHRREHVVIIRPGKSGMIAHTMFYPEEVRQGQEYRPDPSSIVPRELDMAKKLIETMVTPFEPEKFKDTYRERLEQIIAEKVEGHRIAHEPPTGPKKAAVIDIMQALQESLNMAKKPPARSTAAKTTRAAGRARK